MRNGKLRGDSRPESHRVDASYGRQRGFDSAALRCIRAGARRAGAAAVCGRGSSRARTRRKAIVQVIGATRPGNGLIVRAELDTNPYPAGIKVSDADMAALSIRRHAFHG